MAYKRDQGRFARMAAFWSLFFLLGYGTIRSDGLVQTLRSWLQAMGGHDLVRPWIDPFPILGRLDLPMAISLAVLVAGGVALSVWLNRPKVADLLIDTEGELRKVTWPTFADTWKGTLAVVVTVVFMLAYLTTVDIAIHWAVGQLMMRGG